MSRPAGRRNADYDEERRRLLGRLHQTVLERRAAGMSFREMAEVAGVSPATLRHYFGGRDEVVAAVLAAARREGEPYLRAVAAAPAEALRPSLATLLRTVVEGWRVGVGALHEFALGEGLGSDALGPACVSELLEPTLQALELRLGHHVSRGELGPCDLRHAALALLSPVLLALLHQDSLRGSRCRPLDLERFLDEQVDRFLRAYGAASGESSAC